MTFEFPDLPEWEAGTLTHSATPTGNSVMSLPPLLPRSPCLQAVTSLVAKHLLVSPWTSFLWCIACVAHSSSHNQRNTPFVSAATRKASFNSFLQPVVHNWSIKCCGMCCPLCGKVHIKDPLLLIGKSSLCGDSGFPLKKLNKHFKVNVNPILFYPLAAPRLLTLFLRSS